MSISLKQYNKTDKITLDTNTKITVSRRSYLKRRIKEIIRLYHCVYWKDVISIVKESANKK